MLYRYKILIIFVIRVCRPLTIFIPLKQLILFLYLNSFALLSPFSNK